MLRVIILITLLIPTVASSSSLEIVSTKELNFSGAIGGFNQVITVSPHDYNAAILQVLHGEPNAWVILKPVSKTTNLVGTSNENDIIRVNKITFGGSVGADGKARLDSSGNLKNIRIGGSVTITPRNKDNLYIYSPTIRVEYF